MSYTSHLVDKICEFTYKHDPELAEHPEEYRDVIELHFEYKTIDFYLKDGEVKGFYRYNIIDNDMIAHDLIIDKDVKGLKLIRYFLLNNWMRYPYVENFVFSRERRGDPRIRRYKMRDFINIKFSDKEISKCHLLCHS